MNLCKGRPPPLGGRPLAEPCVTFFNHFLDVLSRCFCIDFWLQNRWNMDPQIVPNRSKIKADSRRRSHWKKDRFWDPCWDILSSMFGRFWRPFLLSSAPLCKAFMRSCQIKKLRKKQRVLHQKWHLRRSNIDTKLSKKGLTKTFGSDIKNNDQKTSDSVPNFLPFWSQDRSKFAPKSIRKLIQILLASWHRFLIDLRRFWDPRWGARVVQRTTVFDQKSDRIPPGRPKTL